MVVTFLGTGTSQGVPVIACDCLVCRSIDFRDKRLRVSIHIQIEDKSLVVDAGPDFRQQMLNERIKNLDAILFTHEHKDHTGGLDDIRAFNFKQNKAIPIYARQQVLEQLKQEYNYIFAEVEKYPGIPEVETHTIENHPFWVEGIEIQPIDVLHLYLPVFGFRIKDFTYITDVNKITEEEKEKIKGSAIFVVSALQKEEHLSHYNLTQALELIQEVQPERAYITHISHKMGLHKQIEKELPPNVFLAYDGLKLEL